MLKRTQSPDPKPGMWQYSAFKDMFGEEWHAYDNAFLDTQKKVTEFDFENFFPAGFLKHQNTESDEFKRMVRELNFDSKTDLEQHQANQQLFRGLMPFMSQLTEKEGRDFIHLYQNNTRRDTLEALHSG
jgi:hypothetical protein